MRGAALITTAGVIMTMVFLGFSVTDETEVRMIGIGLATAVLIDITIVRLLLAPALLELLGERAWWAPAWLGQKTPRLDPDTGVASRTLPESRDGARVASQMPGQCALTVRSAGPVDVNTARPGREGRTMTHKALSDPRTSSPAPQVAAPPTTRHGHLTPRSVWWFFAATFAVTWGLGMVVMLFLDQIESVFGPMGYTNPVFVLMVYSPGFVALVMVWRHYGVRGLGGFLRRLTLWRMSLGWWLLLLVGMPAVFYAGAAVNGTATDFPFDPWVGVLPALIPAFLIGPIEELGWRGIALPLLQRRFAPLWAALIVGAVAAFWHTPAFLMSGTKQSAWSYWPFFFGVVAISVILTPMFNAARGSLLVAAVFHAQMNGPAWPDAQPWDMLGFVIVAVVVVLVQRHTMLTPGTGAVDVVLPPGDAERTGRPAPTPDRAVDPKPL